MTPFQPGLLWCIIGLVLEGDRKHLKIGLATEVAIGGADAAAKSVHNTYLLVIMCVRLPQKNGLHNLKNRILF